MIPLVMGVVTAAQSAGAANLAGQLSDGISQLFGGDSANVRNQRARIAGLRTRALTGDEAAVVALGFEAFEKRNGLQGDPRTPRDGKASPEKVRSDAVKALKAYLTAFGALPAVAAQWSVKLNNAPVAAPPKPLQGILDQAIDGITDRAIDRAAERATSTAQDAIPYIIGGGVLVALVLVLVVARDK